MDDQASQKILAAYPFLSLITYGDNEYIGIIQNFDDSITTIYDYGILKSDEQKVAFLQLAEAWWEESNRMIPINVFLKQEWTVFRHTLKTLNSKEVEIKCGPYVSLKEMIMKRTKRRSITLVRKMI